MGSAGVFYHKGSSPLPADIPCLSLVPAVEVLESSIPEHRRDATGVQPVLAEGDDLQAALFLRGDLVCGFPLFPAFGALIIADLPGRIDKVEGRDGALEAFTTRLTHTGSSLSLPVRTPLRR